MDDPSLVDQLFAAYNGHDLAAVEELYTEQGTHEDVAIRHPKHGPKDIVEGLEYFLSRFPDAHWKLYGHVNGPSSSAGWYRLTGTLRADFGKIAASEQQLDLRGVMVFTHDGRKIISTSDYWDMQTFQRQMKEPGLAL
jgi:steroid delta-isomerase-like uncharacterized protein